MVQGICAHPGTPRLTFNSHTSGSVSIFKTEYASILVGTRGSSQLGPKPFSTMVLDLDNLPQLLAPCVALTQIAVLIIVLAVQYVRSPWRKVPPGPKGLPIVGNALQLHDRSWMFEKDNKRNFEHLMYLNALGQPILVINSLKTAVELLDRRASIYSGRPRFIVAQDLLCGGLFTVFMRNGDVWRRTRRAAHEMLTKAAVNDYHPVLRKEAILLASAVLKNPDDIDKHIQRTSASANDYPTLEGEDDEILTRIHAILDCISAACAPGTHLVELFPWMIHIPERFTKWKREAMDHFRQHSADFGGHLDTVSNDVAKGFERPSVSASLIKNSNRSGLSKTEISWLVETLYAGSTDTTGSTLVWWVLAMIAHPEIQKRAQDELDAVVGRSRAPTFADAPNLPYIQAIIKESLRWRPAAPFGIPHTTTEDDWYEGMFIPKGTMCMVNLWHCHHDPATYGSDATSFSPERFLDEHGRLISGPVETRDDGQSSYGFGRRVCVGKHAANEVLFIDMATVLWAALLERACDASGREMPLDTESQIDTGVIFRPVPYLCKITPRFPEAASILSKEIELLKA